MPCAKARAKSRVAKVHASNVVNKGISPETVRRKEHAMNAVNKATSPEIAPNARTLHCKPSKASERGTGNPTIGKVVAKENDTKEEAKDTTDMEAKDVEEEEKDIKARVPGQATSKTQIGIRILGTTTQPAQTDRCVARSHWAKSSDHRAHRLKRKPVGGNKWSSTRQSRHLPSPHSRIGCPH